MSEPVAAIALGGLRSLLRSPEAKMMLLSPLIMIPIFGMIFVRGGPTLPEPARPLIAVAGMAIILFGLLQLMGNQFGFDRDGFRVYVLSAAPRRDILLGKNLAFAPLALGMDAALLPAVQWFCPMRLDHFLAAVPQALSMYLLLCMLTNLLSIYAPYYVAPGAMNAANPKLSTVLAQVLMFMVLFPLTQAAALLPLGIEALANVLGWAAGAPLCLLLSLAECAAIVLLYRLALAWQGSLFQARELRILEAVTRRAP
jgi:hypothetical protein